MLIPPDPAFDLAMYLMTTYMQILHIQLIHTKFTHTVDLRENDVLWVKFFEVLKCETFSILKTRSTKFQYVQTLIEFLWRPILLKTRRLSVDTFYSDSGQTRCKMFRLSPVRCRHNCHLPACSLVRSLSLLQFLLIQILK